MEAMSAGHVWGHVRLTSGGIADFARRMLLQNCEASDNRAIGQVSRFLQRLLVVSLLSDLDLGFEDFHELLDAVLLGAKLLKRLQDLSQL
jgi:hypothetical protein